MTMPPHNILIIVDLNCLAEPREENFVCCFPTQVLHSTQKKKKKISYPLLMQVTTRHFQKKFSGTPNINCLAPPLNRPKRGRGKKKNKQKKEKK
jgi:hypothetical protein